jgi:hypothetical protein
MHSSAGREPIRRPELPTATRWASNPNWSYRGDNTKYRSKK